MGSDSIDRARDSERHLGRHDTPGCCRTRQSGRARGHRFVVECAESVDTGAPAPATFPTTQILSIVILLRLGCRAKTMAAEADVRSWFQQRRVSRRIVDWLFIGLIGLLFAGAAVLVYVTGGTKLAWPYVILMPVLIAAARFGVTGGVLGGVIGGLLIGPLMPLDVAADIPQQTENWLIRLAFYTGLGAFTGLLFRLKNRESARREVDARTDTDSGLPNKTALMEALEEFRSSGLDRCPLLHLVRVVQLAEIIGVTGAAAADELIVEIARRLRSHVGEQAQAYRFSASELMLVMPAPTQTPEEIAERAAHSVDEPIEVRGIPVHVELVMGSAGGDISNTEPRDLVRQARMSMVAAAEHHRSHSHYSPTYERESARSVMLLGRVRHGLQANEFELYYQPKIRASDSDVDGCEALIRWHDAEGSLIPPGQFMPSVERSALIDPLTRFVVQAANDFAVHPDARPLSINFTVRNLLDRELAEFLRRTAAENELAAESIEIEITEGAIIRDPAAARQAIEQLREHGFRVSLDDFGTGYSSFEYLRFLPLTGLKIDRAFVHALDSDPRAEQLMTCMVQVGHALGLEVVAEGVETGEHVAFLRRIGCDVLQGFYFARPMPGTRYREWYQQYMTEPFKEASMV